MQPAWRIAQPFCLALGPAVNSPEPIWYIGCKVLDEQEKLFYSQTYFERNYPDLSRWTKETPNGPRDCFVTFGTGLSYFACARGRGSLWAGVSSELTDKVQKALETPCCVALGIDQAWFVMWPNGSFAWKFYGKYGGLEGILRDAPPGSVSYLAISPYHKEQYFIAFVDRTVKYNFTGCPEWIPQIEEVFREWQAEILKNQRVSMALPPPSIAEMPAQWNQYLPNPGQPAYVAAHYAGSPPPSSLAFPPYSPDAATSPPQFAVELPAAVPNGLLAPASGTRPESIAPSTASSVSHGTQGHGLRH
ncbi:hypothetical protein M011DRAFT_393482 [Sporormia fimetaria CBS 119925]|uniref:Uncharacterized protein n=1 Tax=Sporormia fimetaria CBS 119925 TaxID=1340428 RepID=A0A6A6VPT6_9PLEO|nr:hypothetical protein M011DRAFT_393482 [Sporormia fimetaria CBS 119925]